MLKKRLNKNRIRRILNKKLELKLKVLKTVMFFNLPQFNIIKYIYKIISKINNNYFFTRTNNICITTGRQSGVYKNYRLSRIEVRSSKYNIFGFRKSSW